MALGDETHKCFFNTRGTDVIDPKLDQVLTFLETALPGDDDNPLIEAMTTELKRIKSNSEWRTEFMNLYLRDKEKYQEGVDHGIKAERALAQKQNLDTARSLIGLLTPEVISAKFNIPVEELLEQQPNDNIPKA